MRSQMAMFGVLVGFFCAAAVSAAETVKPVEGKLSLGEHTYVLAHIVAYETKFDDETQTTVLASDRKLPAKAIVTALREGQGSDSQLSLRQPYLKLVFNKAGANVSCAGSADGTFFTASSDTNEFKLIDGRAQGRATMEEKGEGRLKRSFEIRFDVAVGLDEAPKPTAKAAGPVKPIVTGTFKGNGKDAKLTFVSALPHEPFGDKTSLMLVFTEKDHSREKRPDIKAGFGSFGSALIISLHEEDGNVFGCEVSHAALNNKTFSSLGSIHTEDFEVIDGQVSGRIKTDGQVETFNQTWEVDIKFTAPYTAPKPPAAAPTATNPAPADSPVAKTPRSKRAARKAEATAEPNATAMPAINVHDLPFPKDAAEIEYKELVQHLSFKSPSMAVQPLAAELSKSLAAQGWKEEGGNLVTPKSAILSHKRGEASLTIFVKPDGKGSRVNIMSEGLDWSEKAK